MKGVSKLLYTVAIICFSGVLFSFNNYTSPGFPYKLTGLTERQAAAHLLSRFTYGARPGDIDNVLKTGVDKWFMQQLKGGLSDNELNARLRSYNAINLSNSEVVNTYPKAAQVLRMAVREGVINKDSVNRSDKAGYKKQLAAYMQQKGLKSQKEFFRQFINQKILRAAFTNNQLQEVMTDFWFNHFNVSITKNNAAEFIPAYERDVIRKNALGKFEDLLVATAKSPAMLIYLDNFSSAGLNLEIGKDGDGRVQQMSKGMSNPDLKERLNKAQKLKKNQGLNENYAREVMELHTLGVDGGYTQQDVTHAAKILTGWTVFPISNYGGSNAMAKIVERIGEDKLEQRGFVHEGDFLFAANRHDNSEKRVLGKTFPAGGGYNEGVQLLKMLAHHPSTAKFISQKIAVRFVSDNPPQRLVDKMAKTFTEHDGDIKQVMLTMVSSPEFWSKEAIREKTKSPFELAISTVRSLDADIKMPYQLYNWIDKMGQKMYFYQAPTGFPDKGVYWINTGSLLNRMNFGLALASGRIPGVKVDLLGLNNGREPESAEAALLTFSRIMMPERNVEQTIKRLTPLLHDPELGKKIDNAAGKTPLAQSTDMATVNEDAEMEVDKIENDDQKLSKRGRYGKQLAADETGGGNNNMMAQVVGIIIGSPEFQRR